MSSSKISSETLERARNNDPSLTLLNCPNSQLKDTDLTEVLDILIVNTNLRELYLVENQLTDETGLRLAEILTVNTTLRWLVLSKNSFTDKTGKRLAKVLATSNSTLRGLNLKQNKITDKTRAKMAKMLASNRTLNFVEFGSCEAPPIIYRKFEQAIYWRSNLQVFLDKIVWFDRPAVFCERTKHVDLRGRQLTNKVAARLPFPPETETVDLRDNPLLTQIPTSLAILDPTVTHKIQLDLDIVPPFVESTRDIIGYARYLATTHYHETLEQKMFSIIAKKLNVLNF